jgi:hypothetical protein
MPTVMTSGDSRRSKDLINGQRRADPKLTLAGGAVHSRFLSCGLSPSPYTIAVLVVPSLIQSAQSSWTFL